MKRIKTRMQRMGEWIKYLAAKKYPVSKEYAEMHASVAGKDLDKSQLALASYIHNESIMSNSQIETHAMATVVDKTKVVISIVTAVVAMIMPIMPSFAAYEEVGNIRYYYTVNNGMATIGDGKDHGSSLQYKAYGSWTRGVPSGTTSLTIPSTLGGYPVVKINNHAFDTSDNMINIKQIVLPPSLSEIGSYAFSYCYALSSLSIPGSVTSIGSFAFYEAGISTLTFEVSTNSLSLAKKALDMRQSSYSINGPATIIFHRDAPSSIGSDATPNTTSTTIWVSPTSKGWGVTIPGKWRGASIKYLKTVDFDANGGVVSAPTRLRVDGGKVGSLPTPTRTEATFNGWYTAKTGGSKISESTTISANTVFYAQWTVNEYTVTFDPNEGEGGDSRTQEYGSPLGVLPVPQRNNHFFLGWFTEIDGGEQINETSFVSGEKTYYAHWEQDPIPELGSGDTVADALESSADSRLPSRILSKRQYSTFRFWVDDHALTHKSVMTSPNAWLAYVLDSPELIAKDGAVKNKDLKVDKLDMPAGTAGSMNFTFGIEDAVVGEEAEIDEAFAVEGSETLDDSSFSTVGLQVSLDRTADGRVKATVTPPSGKSAYFMRVKVK